MFTWDKNKSESNRAKHGLAFEAVHDFDWDDPVIIDCCHHENEEKRYAAIGMLKNKLHTVIFTYRGDDIRIISMRRSNMKEERTYAKTK
jgi:uncharacterized DUF497 family protein